MYRRNQAFTAFVTLITAIGAYVVYDQTLGRFTDFPQLELGLQTPLQEIGQLPDPGIIREYQIAARRGFGPGCPELNPGLWFESRKRTGSQHAIASRGIGLFIYANDYEILPENNRRVRFRPFSLVYIVPSKDGVADHDEIHTVRGEEAVIELDQPITASELTKVASLNAVGGWVESKSPEGIELRTNRGTADPADDIWVHTDKLHYREDRSLVWADGAIRLGAGEDTTIEGVGMEIELYPRLKPGEPAVEKKAEAKTVRLFKSVRFDLPVNEESDFLSASTALGEPGKTPVARKPSPVTILANGPFVFDLEKDWARFQNQVRVYRKTTTPQQTEAIDQLESDQLDLQFDRQASPAGSQAKPSPAGVAAGKAANGTTSATNADKSQRRMKLLNATAIGREVILRSDSQGLMATGNYLYHDALAGRAVLRGQKEMIAYHDNSVIHARSLVIERGEDKTARTIVADGPDGWLEIMDAKPEQPGTGAPTSPRLRIRWQDRLSVVSKPGSEIRVVEISKDVELDDLRGAMQCDLLKVWLVPVEKARGVRDATVPASPKIVQTGKAGRKLEPIKLEASGNVSAHSDDLAVLTEHLNMEIIYPKEVAGADQPAKPTVTKADAKPANGAAAAKPKDSEPKPASEPLYVRAKRVAVIVERHGTRSKPVRAWAVGQVFVTQTPKKPGQDPLEIRGQKLQFERQPEGDVMVVNGDDQNWAVIKSTEIELAGQNQIDLNEVDNAVHVAGPGYLIRESENDLTGKKTDGPRPLRIDWERAMDFDGKYAVFGGNVKARQGAAEIRCQSMEATFDRKLIFRELRDATNRKTAQKTRIEAVDCDQDVLVFDTETEENNVVRYMTTRATELHYDNIYRTVVATGKGVVRVIEPNRPGPDEFGRNTSSKYPYQITQVVFQGQMRGDNKSHIAKFFENVEILHSPIDKLDQIPNEDSLPPEAMKIEARDHVEMSLSEKEDGKKYRDFLATGAVRVRAREFWGQCDRLSYDQRQDKLVFDSLPDRKAYFYRQARPGEEATRYAANTHTYWRKAGRHSSVGSDGFNALDVAPQERRP